jgi:peroxiredoxin
MPRGLTVRAFVFAVLLAVASPHAPAAPYSLLGQSAPDFALRAVGGPNVRLSEHRGDVVIVTFWSSRCGPCSAQLAALERSVRTFGAAGLTVFGVNVDDDPERAKEFAGAQPVRFALLLDPGKDVSRLYRVDSLPMTLLVDRSGAIRHVHRDYDARSEARFRQELRALLNE